MSAPSGSPASNESGAVSPFGPGVPVLPENATAEQKDLHWYKHVYQGDRMPQLTWRAVLMGGFLGMAMSAANLYTTLSIGWSFGIAITACVLSFVIWNFVRFTSGGHLSQMSVLENACMASTASAAGYSTGSTIATMFGALVLLEEIPEGKTAADIATIDVTPWWVVVIFTLCTGLMGVFLAIPMKRQMINHEQLPFPSGTAAAETLRSLYSESKEAVRKAYALVVSLGAGLLIGFLRAADDIIEAIPWLKSFFGFFKDRIRIPAEIEMHFIDKLYPGGRHSTGFAFEPSALLIAAGMIVGMRISLSLVISSALLYIVVGPWLAQADAVAVEQAAMQALAAAKAAGADPAAAAKAATAAATAAAETAHHKMQFIWGWGSDTVTIWRWSLWGGTAVMVFSSLTSVALQWKTIVRAFTGVKSETGAHDAAGMAKIEVPGFWMILGMVPITVAMVWLQIVAFGVSWYAGVIAVAMSFVLSMVASRATGETDTTPIGAMGKVMQLMFAALAPKNIAANLASAGIAANSASSSADLLTDLKTGYLLGANPRKQFLAQLVGCFFGTLAVVPAWYLMVPNFEALDKFAKPATMQWYAVTKILTQGFDQLPVSARWLILVGAIVGVLLPLIEKLTPVKARKYLPSAMGLGLAWVIPFSSALGFAAGAVVAWVWGLLHKSSEQKFSVALASGLIAGEGLIKAIIAMSATVIGIKQMTGK